MAWYRQLAVVALVSGASALYGSHVDALPLAAGATDIASQAEDQGLTIDVAARRAVPRAVPRTPRAGVPRTAARPFIRTPRVVRPQRFVRPRVPVIIGIGPGYYYEPFPYYYEPYYYDDDYEAPYDAYAIADCIRRFKSYDVRTRTYLGYDGLRHPCP